MRRLEMAAYHVTPLPRHRPRPRAPFLPIILLPPLSGQPPLKCLLDAGSLLPSPDFSYPSPSTRFPLWVSYYPQKTRRPSPCAPPSSLMTRPCVSVDTSRLQALDRGC